MKPRISSTSITHPNLTERHAKFLRNIGLYASMADNKLYLESTDKAFISRIRGPLKITVVDPQICLKLRVKYKTLTSHIKVNLFSRITIKLRPTELRNICIMTSGGDAPGMNTIIRAVVLSSPAKVYGAYYGFDGLIKGDFELLTSDSVTYHSTLGGTFLKSARSKDFMERINRKEVVYNLNCRKIDALVAIGGDGTMKGLQALVSEFEELNNELLRENRITRKRSLSVVAIPASIDNDISYCDITVGANTCLHRVVDSIDSLATTMASHGRCFVIETMGRHCGWISLFSHFAVSAEYVFLPEVPHENWESDVTKSVQHALNLGKSGCFVVVSEGALNKRGEKILSDTVRKLIEDKVKCECRVLKLGHIQRGGNPSAFDRILATMLGCKAVEHIFGCTSSSPDKANTYLMDGKYGERKDETLRGDSLCIEDVSYSQDPRKCITREATSSADISSDRSKLSKIVEGDDYGKASSDGNTIENLTSFLRSASTTTGNVSINVKSAKNPLARAVVATLHNTEYCTIPLQDVISANDRIADLQIKKDFQALLDVRGALFKRVHVLSEQLRLSSNLIEMDHDIYSEFERDARKSFVGHLEMTGYETGPNTSITCDLVQKDDSKQSGQRKMEKVRELNNLSRSRDSNMRNSQFTIDQRTFDSTDLDKPKEFLGILHVGQRAGGTNTALHVAVRYATSLGLKPLVIHNGFDGVVQRCFELPTAYGFSNQCLSGTPALRAGALTIDPITILNHLKQLKLTKVVVIGDRSAVRAVNVITRAMEQTKNFCCSFIVIPVCFENSLPLVSETVGADSALNFLVAACDSLRNSSTSGEAVLIAEVDENGGMLTALGGIAANATASFLPNVRYSAKYLTRLSKKLSSKVKSRKSYINSIGLVRNTDLGSETGENTGYLHSAKTRSENLDTLNQTDSNERRERSTNLASGNSERRLRDVPENVSKPGDKTCKHPEKNDYNHREELQGNPPEIHSQNRKISTDCEHNELNNYSSPSRSRTNQTQSGMEFNATNSILILKNSRSLPDLTPKQLKQLIANKNIELRTCSMGDLIHGGQVSPFDRIMASVCAIKAIDILSKSHIKDKTANGYVSHVLIKRGTTLELIHVEDMCLEMDKKRRNKWAQIEKLHKLIE